MLSLKHFLILLILNIPILLSSQHHQPSAGIEFTLGKRSYRGDLGNGFFNYKQSFHGMAGLRGIYSLRKNLDLVSGFSLGRTGFTKDSSQRFLSNVFGLTGEVRYYPGTQYFRSKGIRAFPFVSIGLGFQRYSPVDTLAVSSLDLAIPVGLGIRYEMAAGWEVFGQLRWGYNFGDKYDKVADLKGNDHFLTSELGIRYRFPLVKDTDGDGIPDQEDRCPHIRGVRKNHGCPKIKKSTKKVFEEAVQAIHFEVDKDVILPESYPILNRIVEVMKKHPYIKLTITGHTDSDGSAAHNLDLSRRRAKAVKSFLVTNGIAADRMTTAGYGEAVPIADNNTPEGKSLNRRVEFEIGY